MIADEQPVQIQTNVLSSFQVLWPVYFYATVEEQNDAGFKFPPSGYM